MKYNCNAVGLGLLEGGKAERKASKSACDKYIRADRMILLVATAVSVGDINLNLSPMNFSARIDTSIHRIDTWENGDEYSGRVFVISQKTLVIGRRFVIERSAARTLRCCLFTVCEIPNTLLNQMFCLFIPQSVQ